MINLEYIFPNEINAVWDSVKDFIEKGLNGSSEYGIEHVKQYLLNGNQSLLIMIESNQIVGAIVIEITKLPNETIAFISSIGGKKTKEIWNQLINWCKNKDATVIRGCASESVFRLWRKQFNFEKRYIVVEKKL